MDAEHLLLPGLVAGALLAHDRVKYRSRASSRRWPPTFPGLDRNG
ncbi:MAG TPA: hypothetical protein VLP43_05950 [Solirubrobacteraceae bacterium]|nr:hypothetical protein [Solirubrobacteraceae bacterium]